ncbi:unnamed protein product [Vicia faba]|uniref:Uncharacterized protein n=1 Tax=Vicia faba TaxID=3906 RepID=A0AAV0ZF79_VICFA|nr:unnamed protein product [Vicia faba]
MDPETVSVEISSFAMQLNNFTCWTLHSRVKEEVEKTCFKYFTRFPTTEIKIPKQMIVALLRFYDYNEEHFVFGDTKVDLEDISGFEPGDPIETIVNHLSLHPVEANDLLLSNKRGKKSHNISLKRLKEKFQSIDVTEENVFAFERFKCLREIFNFAIPSRFPLMLGWANETSEILRNRSLMPTMETCFYKLREMADEDVDLLPYSKNVLEAELADQFKYQSWMEGDVDERETESPPRCNLPTPRDEVSSSPFFDSSLSHEALSIQTPQEVLSSQMHFLSLTNQNLDGCDAHIVVAPGAACLPLLPQLASDSIRHLDYVI